MGIAVSGRVARNRVDLSSKELMRQWRKHFGASVEKIEAAIEKVGDNPESVQKQLALKTDWKTDETHATFHSTSKSVSLAGFASNPCCGSWTCEIDRTGYFRQGTLAYRITRNGLCLCRQFVCRGQAFQNHEAELAEAAVVRRNLAVVYFSRCQNAQILAIGTRTSRVSSLMARSEPDAMCRTCPLMGAEGV
jgi:hypothetical protein